MVLQRVIHCCTCSNHTYDDNQSEMAGDFINHTSHRYESGTVI